MSAGQRAIKEQVSDCITGLVSLNHDEALASAFWGGGFLVIRGDTTAGVASDHEGTILRYGVGTNGRRVRRNYARYARR